MRTSSHPGFQRSTFWALVVAFALGGCQCSKCGNTISTNSGGGSGGHSGGGSGGGSGTGGGTGTGGGAGGTGGGANYDGGPIVGTVPPGGFNLDGGSTDGGPSEGGNGVSMTPDGGLTLNTNSQEFYFMWIANNAQGWVSKYDTRTGKEVARYWSVFPLDCYSSPGNLKGPPCTEGKPNGLTLDQSNNPSRTALDLNGDVWVANRAIGLQGSVTKIANDPSGCIDRNHNGKIDTSSDLNGDGQISTNPADGEMFIPTNYQDPLQYDECVLFSTAIGTNGADVAVRAIAISLGSIESVAGYVGAGVYRDAQVHKLDTVNGQPIPVDAAGDMTIPISWGMYGGIVDSKQRLWLVQPGVAHLAEIDTATGTLLSDQIVPPAGTTCGAYALGIDGKDRVWLPGWTAGSVACRFDPSSNVWTSFDFSTAVSNTGSHFARPRGIAVDVNGHVYMSADYDQANTTAVAQLIRFDAETGAIIPYPGGQFIDATDANTSSSIGVGIDGDGQPWVNMYSGNAVRFDNASGTLLRTAQQPAGLYTYSDFTGYELRKFTAPKGTYFKDFAGCDPNTSWQKLSWVGNTPPGTQIQAFIKVGSSLAALNSASTMSYGPFTTSPADLTAAGVPKAQYARVTFVLLTTMPPNAPTLMSYQLTWSCSGVIN